MRPALQIVEREFGLLEIHARSQAEVLASGEAVLAHLGLTEKDRVKPEIASAQFVTNVSPYQAQLLNKWRKGSLMMPGSSLFVLEVAPAAYATLAANEAEKAGNITVVEVRAVGRYGRVFLSGSESEVQTARDAAVFALRTDRRRVVSVIGVPTWSNGAHRDQADLTIAKGDLVHAVGTGNAPGSCGVQIVRDGAHGSAAVKPRTTGPGGSPDRSHPA